METIPQTPEEYRAWWQEQRPNIPYGYCWCGCGQATSKAKDNQRSLSHFRGEPVRHVLGHGGRKPLVQEDQYKVEHRGYKTACWIWRKAKTVGYGRLKRDRNYLAHRLYYEHYRGPIEPGLTLDHLCRNRDCVNPNHVEPTTTATNTQRGLLAKLTPEQAREIRTKYASGDYTQRALAREYQISQSTLCQVVNRNAWRNA